MPFMLFKALASVIDLVHFLLDVGQAEGDILVDGHVRPERVILKQKPTFALVGAIR